MRLKRPSKPSLLDFRPGRLEAAIPKAKGAGIIVAEAGLVAEPQSGFVNLPGQRRIAWQHAAGEDVFLDVVGLAAVLLEIPIGDGDDLQRGTAAGFTSMVAQGVEIDCGQ